MVSDDDLALLRWVATDEEPAPDRPGERRRPDPGVDRGALGRALPDVADDHDAASSRRASARRRRITGATAFAMLVSTLAPMKSISGSITTSAGRGSFASAASSFGRSSSVK